MKIKIMGYGEIGQAITKYIESHSAVKLDIFIQDPKFKLYPPSKMQFDMILVCIPFTDNFVQLVMKELSFSPKIVIFSTVPIGTTEQIKNAIHIPIEGRHPDLYDSICKWQFFMGYNTDMYIADYEAFFNMIGKPVIPVIDSKNTETAKLLSTLLYGVNIEFYRYAEEMYIKNGANIKLFKDYNKSYNDLYSGLGYTEFKRYILDPPDGEIGGHCVLPNASFLNGIFPEIVRNTYKGVKI